MSDLIEQLQRFVFERLPKPSLCGSKPCIAEDWFIEDARPQAPNWLSNDDLRRIWRVARLHRLGEERGAGCPWLLLHQLADLTEAMFSKAEAIMLDQRAEKVALAA